MFGCYIIEKVREDTTTLPECIILSCSSSLGKPRNQDSAL